MIATDPCTDTYQDVEKLLNKLCWQACKRNHQLDFDECMSRANLAYMKAYESYDEDRGAAFSTWVYWQVMGALQHHERQETVYFQRMTSSSSLMEGREPDTSNRVSMAESIIRGAGSSDSKQVLKCILETPEELGQVLADLGTDSKMVKQVFAEFPSDLANMLRFWDPQKLRVGLKSLLSSMGWTKERIVNTLEEMQSAVDLVSP